MSERTHVVDQHFRKVAECAVGLLSAAHSNEQDLNEQRTTVIPVRSRHIADEASGLMEVSFLA
jgi:hypothetical protein